MYMYVAFMTLGPDTDTYYTILYILQTHIIPYCTYYRHVLYHTVHITDMYYTRLYILHTYHTILYILQTRIIPYCTYYKHVGKIVSQFSIKRNIVCYHVVFSSYSLTCDCVPHLYIPVYIPVYTCIHVPVLVIIEML